MLKELADLLVQNMLTREERKRIETAPMNLNSAGYDPWGLEPETVKIVVSLVRWLYTDYFRVETTGLESVPEGRCLVIANHGGQIPVDGMLISLSLLLDANPPRLSRGMIERWVPGLPFVSTLFTRVGQVTGDPRNCEDLLNKEECVTVFPEGVKGSGKTIFERYQLQRFGTGFVRLALQTKSPILPCAVIGCEEAYPALMKSKLLAKLFQAPYFPITPLFPLAGILGALPLPTKVTLRYAKPIYLEGDPDMPDAEVQKLVEQVRSAIQAELDEGLRIRGSHIFSKAGLKRG